MGIEKRLFFLHEIVKVFGQAILMKIMYIKEFLITKDIGQFQILSNVPFKCIP